MKKSVLFIAMMLLGTTLMTAQEYVRFGAKGGVNFTNMTSDGFDDRNSRTGFHLGLLGEVPVSRNFSIQPEVLYSTQGTEASTNIAGVNTTGEYKLDYIQVPVMAKFYIFSGVALEVGPSFNFLVEEEVNYTSGSTSGSMETDLGSTFEFAGAAGLSFNIARSFFISGRYIHGFTDAFNSDNWDQDAVNNNGFQLGVGFMF